MSIENIDIELYIDTQFWTVEMRCYLDSRLVLFGNYFVVDTLTQEVEIWSARSVFVGPTIATYPKFKMARHGSWYFINNRTVRIETWKYGKLRSIQFSRIKKSNEYPWENDNTP